MTISSEIRKAGPYEGNGIASVFPFWFKVFKTSEVVVVYTNPDAEESILGPSDCLIRLNPDQEAYPGGTVATNTPLDVGYLLTITSQVANLQPLDLTNQGGFYPKTINESLDRLTILAQQNTEAISRSVKVPISADIPPEALVERWENMAAQTLISSEAAARSAAAAESSASDANDAADRAEEAAEIAGGRPPISDSVTSSASDVYASSKAAKTAFDEARFSIKYFAEEQPLPTENIGPIWHEKFNSMMTWQEFTANGADYTGYASLLVGSLLMDTQPTPRKGYLFSGIEDFPRLMYPALRAWAMHHGLMVSAGVWAAGSIVVADSADGTTFKLFDVRGEFPRFWDRGRTADASRAFGSWQNNGNLAHTHNVNGIKKATSGGDFSVPYVSGTPEPGFISQSGGVESRPRNTAFLASIKF